MDNYFDNEFNDAYQDIEPVEPNEEEKRNGWTTESLTKYIASQLASQSLTIDIKSLKRKVKPDTQNNRYNPRRWRE